MFTKHKFSVLLKAKKNLQHSESSDYDDPSIRTIIGFIRETFMNSTSNNNNNKKSNKTCTISISNKKHTKFKKKKNNNTHNILISNAHNSHILSNNNNINNINNNNKYNNILKKIPYVIIRQINLYRGYYEYHFYKSNSLLSKPLSLPLANIVIHSSTILSCKEWNDNGNNNGGVIYIHCNTITNYGHINCDGKGYYGPIGQGYGKLESVNNNIYYGGAGYGTKGKKYNNKYGIPGNVYGNQKLSNIHFGCGNESKESVSGKGGGGIIIINANNKITNYGLISCNGIDGFGASGGSIFIYTPFLENLGEIIAKGSNQGRKIGSGGSGRIATYCNVSKTLDDNTPINIKDNRFSNNNNNNINNHNNIIHYDNEIDNDINYNNNNNNNINNTNINNNTNNYYNDTDSDDEQTLIGNFDEINTSSEYLSAKAIVKNFLGE